MPRLLPLRFFSLHLLLRLAELALQVLKSAELSIQVSIQVITLLLHLLLLLPAARLLLLLLLLPAASLRLLLLLVPAARLRLLLLHILLLLAGAALAVCAAPGVTVAKHGIGIHGG
jgi:hypothetical protein